jgi:(2Fe-2S) ferredoxin
MAKRERSPYVTHVFICTNDRGGARRSCADGDSPAIRAALKQVVTDRGWRGRVRVSSSGCLGLCDRGPNLMLYPRGTWFSQTTPDDLGLVISEIETILDEAEELSDKTPRSPKVL